MTKKISVLIAALIFTVSAMSGCSDSKKKGDSTSSASSQSEASSGSEAASDSEAPASPVSEPSLTIDGEKVDTENLVMLTVDGRDVSFDEFRYYYFTALSQMSQTYGTTMDTLAQTENGFESLLERTVTNIKQDYVSYRLCSDNGIELNDEDKAKNEELYNNFRSNAASDEEYETVLAESYMTDDIFRKRIELASIYVKVEENLLTNGGAYATSKEDFKNIVQDPAQYACVRSILIPYSCKAEITDSETAAAYDGYSLQGKMSAKNAVYDALSEDDKKAVREQSQALANEVLEKAKNGEDFEQLITEYGWDPGMESSPEGYYITPKTSFVQEYLDAVFAMNEGDISPLVENSTYGWFIIKRMPIDMDYVEENIDNMIVEYDTPKIEQLYMDTMEKMEITYSDSYKKLKIDSIT